MAVAGVGCGTERVGRGGVCVGLSSLPSLQKSALLSAVTTDNSLSIYI
jgi:hypothetical protein